MDTIKAQVQCLKSDLIQESEPEDLLLSPLTLAMPLTLILLIKPLPLTLESDVILDIGPGLISSLNSQPTSRILNVSVAVNKRNGGGLFISVLFLEL